MHCLDTCIQCSASLGAFFRSNSGSFRAFPAISLLPASENWLKPIPPIRDRSKVSGTVAGRSIAGVWHTIQMVQG